MKRILSVILLLVFAWTFCPISRAMTIYTTHFVPELDMTITIPKDYLVYTRETDVEVIKNILLENNIYLDAIDTTTNSELFIVMEDYDLVDFNELGEKEINMLSSFALATLNEKEIQVIENRVESIGQNKYIVLFSKYSYQYQEMYEFNYITATQGKKINIIMQFYSDKYIETNRQIVEKIVSNIKYGNSFQKKLYEDGIIGIKYYIPQNWRIFDSDDEGGIGTTILVPKDNLEYTISIANMDIWQKLPIYEMIKHPRSEFDNSFILNSHAKVELENSLGVVLSKDSIKTVYNYEYIIASTYNNNFGTDDKFTAYIRAENGIVYLIITNIADNSLQYDDFVYFMESIVYPSSTLNLSDIIK